jgi:hypothetical protein
MPIENPANNLQTTPAPVSPVDGKSRRRAQFFTPNTDRPLYERQETESDFQWWCFQEYLAMGAARTIAGVAKIVLAKEPELPWTLSTIRTNCQTYSMVMGWQQRAKDFDHQVELAKAVTQVKAIEQMNERQADTALQLQALCLRELEKYEQQSIDSPNPVMTLPNLLKAIKQAWEAERIARGEPTEIIASQSDRADSVATQRMRELLSRPEAVDILDQLAELSPDDDSVN